MALQEELKKQGDFLFKYRSYLPLLLLVLGVIMKFYQEYSYLENQKPLISTILENSAIYIGVLGLLIRIHSVGYSKKNTSGRNTSEGQVADSLNTKGLYSIMRNPLYLGNYFMWVSVAMLTGNIWFVVVFSLVFWIYYERIVYAEEFFLRNKFGDAYLNWANKTPIFLPTKIFKYKTPEIKFSWKKVMKKEKNGLFSLFLLFFIFQDIIAQYVQQGKIELKWDWISVGTVITGVLYFILKYLKKYTKVLHEEDR